MIKCFHHVIQPSRPCSSWYMIDCRFLFMHFFEDKSKGFTSCDYAQDSRVKFSICISNTVSWGLLPTHQNSCNVTIHTVGKTEDLNEDTQWLAIKTYTFVCFFVWSTFARTFQSFYHVTLPHNLALLQILADQRISCHIKSTQHEGMATENGTHITQ